MIPFEGNDVSDGHVRREKNLPGEGVNFTLLCRVAVREPEPKWIQQLWVHVPGHPRLGCCRAAWFHDGRISNGARDPKVSEGCIALFGDQDVPLGIKGIGARLNPKTLFFTHRIDITIFNECRYSRPLAACASLVSRAGSQNLCL